MHRLARTRLDFTGEILTWICAGALAVNLLMIVALIGVISVNGLATFWPQRLVQLRLDDGSRVLGAIVEQQAIPTDPGAKAGSLGLRLRLEVGNRDLAPSDFRWIDASKIVSRDEPADVFTIERLEWGDFLGRMVEVKRDGEVIASGEGAKTAFREIAAGKDAEREAIDRLAKGRIGDINRRLERLRLEDRRLGGEGSRAASARIAAHAREREALQAEYDAAAAELTRLRTAFDRETVVMEAEDGARKEIPIGSVVRAIQPNALSFAQRFGVYLSRTWEFVSADPRESNTEGGIFPAIFGTVLMVLLMALAVVPFGVLAAVYLQEYARQGPLVRLVRIAVNNLAGVPSIVFGVFGLGFFVYGVGGSIDRVFYPEALPTPTFGTGGILWASLTLALLTVPVVIVATEEGLAAVPKLAREGSRALGATQWETLRRVVLPAAAPGILTGLILAMARAAGEVAPLMIVGMVKLAPTLPVDGHFPFLHLERKFMHLGFHIYDVGFQSPNVEAAKPLVFATALLLIGVVLTTNLVAILVRNHLRAKYAVRSI